MNANGGSGSDAAQAPLALTAEQRRWVERAAPRVARIASALASSVTHASRDELTSAGYEGLVQAAQRYDPGSGVPFYAFAHHRIRGAMIDHARQSAPAVRRRSRALRLLQASQALLEQAQRESLPGTTADPRTLQQRVAAAAEIVAQQTTAVLLSKAKPRDPDTVAEPSADMETGLLHAELRDHLATLLRRCSEDERGLIEAIYFEGRTMAAYAEEIGKSVSTVSRRHARVIGRLGRSLRELDDPGPTSAPRSPGSPDS
jgi:RNA polymerase sigma factor FliA